MHRSDCVETQDVLTYEYKYLLIHWREIKASQQQQLIHIIYIYIHSILYYSIRISESNQVHLLNYKYFSYVLLHTLTPLQLVRGMKAQVWGTRQCSSTNRSTHSRCGVAGVRVNNTTQYVDRWGQQGPVNKLLLQGPLSWIRPCLPTLLKIR